MPALLHKKKTIICTTSFLLSVLPVQAMQLHLNGNTHLNITGADYLDVLSDVPVESPVLLKDVVVHLNIDANANLNIHYQGVIELFWNGLPLTVPDSDSQWLFANGLCDEAKELTDFSKPENWHLVLPDRKCEGYSDTNDLVFTILAIRHRLPAIHQPKKRRDSLFSAEELNALLNPSFLDIDVTMLDGSGPTASLPWPQPRLPIHPLKAEQQDFFENPANYNHEITVFISNFPVSKGDQKHIPGSAQLNQVVTNAATEKELLSLIFKTMTNLGYTRKRGSIQKALSDFLSKVKDLDGLVNVQRVINYIKEVLRHYNPDSPAIDKANMQETVRQIIMAMAMAGHSDDREKEPQSDEPVAGATGTTVISHSVPASAVPSHHLELVEQLISMHNNNANKIIGFIFSLFPRLSRKGYGNAKKRIRNLDGSVSIRGVVALLELEGNFEPALEAALQQPPQEEEPLQQHQPRLKKPSSQGALDKKKKR